MEELGYGFGMWNRNPASVGLSGTASGHPAANIPNNFVLEFPDPTGPGAELYEPSTLQQVFECVVYAWDPDWAVLTTPPWRDAQSPGQNEPQIGWMSYIAESPTRHLPANVPEAEPFHRCMRLRQGSSPAEVSPEQILQTRDRLKTLGALAPTRWVLPDGRTVIAGLWVLALAACTQMPETHRDDDRDLVLLKRPKVRSPRPDRLLKSSFTSTTRSSSRTFRWRASSKRTSNIQR